MRVSVGADALPADSRSWREVLTERAQNPRGDASGKTASGDRGGRMYSGLHNISLSSSAHDDRESGPSRLLLFSPASTRGGPNDGSSRALPLPLHLNGD